MICIVRKKLCFGAGSELLSFENIHWVSASCMYVQSIDPSLNYPWPAESWQHCVCLFLRGTKQSRRTHIEVHINMSLHCRCCIRVWIRMKSMNRLFHDSCKAQRNWRKNTQISFGWDTYRQKLNTQRKRDRQTVSTVYVDANKKCLCVFSWPLHLFFPLLFSSSCERCIYVTYSCTYLDGSFYLR